MGYQLQQSKKELARFVTYPEVDKDSPVIVDLTDNAQPLGPVVMPPMPAGSSSTLTGFTADSPPPLPCARSICPPTRSLDALIGRKVVKDFGEKYGVFIGVIMSFDATSKLYMVRVSVTFQHMRTCTENEATPPFIHPPIHWRKTPMKGRILGP